MSKLFKNTTVNWTGKSKFDDSRTVIYLKDVDGIIDIGDCNADGVTKGAKVTIEAEQDGKNWKAKRLKVTEAASERSSGGGGWKGRGNGGGGGRGGYNNDPKRQASIVMQHSQEMALIAVRLIVEKEIVKLPAQAKQKAVFDELLAEYTALFFAQASGEKAAAAEAAVEDEPEKEAEADEPEKSEADAEFDDEFDAD